MRGLFGNSRRDEGKGEGGEQSWPPPDMPLWEMEGFKLVIFKPRKPRGKPLIFPRIASKIPDRGPAPGSFHRRQVPLHANARVTGRGAAPGLRSKRPRPRGYRWPAASIYQTCAPGSPLLLRSAQGGTGAPTARTCPWSPLLGGPPGAHMSVKLGVLSALSLVSV